MNKFDYTVHKWIHFRPFLERRRRCLHHLKSLHSLRVKRKFCRRELKRRFTVIVNELGMTVAFVLFVRRKLEITSAFWKRRQKSIAHSADNRQLQRWNYFVYNLRSLLKFSNPALVVLPTNSTSEISSPCTVS